MHRARGFLYVCAGVCFLALAYHLGAQSAGAQSTIMTAANLEVTPYSAHFTGAVGRIVHHTPAPPATYTIATPVPGTEPIVHTGSDGIFLTAILANGDIYQWDGSTWVLRGNLIGGGPTSAQFNTFGSLKSRYRGERGGVQPAVQGR